MLIKRLFDIIASMCGILILSPLLIVIAIIVKFSSRGRILFRQQRVGLHGNLFYIHKFRTMVDNAEALGPKITIGEDNRITAVGRILRKTKFDELPQLFDVLSGNMSLVGPRPEVPEYVALYTDEVKQVVLSVRPGITDWASIKMIDENNILGTVVDPRKTYIEEIMPKKLGYALDYVESHSLTGDIKIIIATFIKIIKR